MMCLTPYNHPVQAEGLMMAISALVNHALLGIAMAACLMGIFMPVAGALLLYQRSIHDGRFLHNT